MAKTKSPLKSRAHSELNEDERKRQLAWANWLAARTGKSLSGLALQAGKGHNVLTRLESRDGGLLSTATIRAITAATGLPGPDAYLLPSAAGFSEEASPFDPHEAPDSVAKNLTLLILKDHPNAQAWRLKTHALEDAGYLPGDYIVTDNAVPFKAGDAVAAQVYDLRSNGSETIFRIIEPPYLVGATNDAAIRKPLLVDDQRVIVAGPIIHSFRSKG